VPTQQDSRRALARPGPVALGARARPTRRAAARAQASTAQLSSAVFHALSDLLTSGPVDYMNETNTHIISMVQLAPIAYSGADGRRRALLAAARGGVAAQDHAGTFAAGGAAARRAASAGARGGGVRPDRASGGGRAGGGGALGGEAGEGRVGRARPWGAHARGRRRVRRAGGRRMGPQARRAAALLPDESAQVRPRSPACEAAQMRVLCSVGRESLPVDVWRDAHG